MNPQLGVHVYEQVDVVWHNLGLDNTNLVVVRHLSYDFEQALIDRPRVSA